MSRIYDSSFLTQRRGEKAAASAFYSQVTNGPSVRNLGFPPMLGIKDSSILYSVKQGSMMYSNRPWLPLCNFKCVCIYSTLCTSCSWFSPWNRVYGGLYYFDVAGPYWRGPFYLPNYTLFRVHCFINGINQRVNLSIYQSPIIFLLYFPNMCQK